LPKGGRGDQSASLSTWGPRARVLSLTPRVPPGARHPARLTGARLLVLH
jgi:hypothetical protein